MKKNRHELILNLIEKFDITTQDELLSRLAENGYDVTQATVSRDIKELRLAKAMSSSGKYRYTAHRSNEKKDYLAKYHAIFKESLISIENARQYVLYKMLYGHGERGLRGN